MSSQPRYRDAEWLREQYVEQTRSLREIGAECGCSEATIRRWMSKHEISTREPGGQHDNCGRKVEFERLADEEWLREQYLEQDKRIIDIAEICGCSDVTVLSWLDKHRIPTQRSVKDERVRDAEWLKEQYSEKGRTVPEIAQELACSAQNLYTWFEKHGIETRNGGGGPSVSGPDHPSWKGGTPGYGVGWNESKRKAVRERDGRVCQDPNCSVTQTDHIDKYGQKLHVHHLRKAREIDDPEDRNAKENLITLCADCHQRWEKIADAGIVPEVVVE